MDFNGLSLLIAFVSTGMRERMGKGLLVRLFLGMLKELSQGPGKRRAFLGNYH